MGRYEETSSTLLLFHEKFNHEKFISRLINNEIIEPQLIYCPGGGEFPAVLVL